MKPKRAWLEASYRAATVRVPERLYPFRTLSNYPVAPVYTHKDLANFDPAEKLGYPGECPYTRGAQASMYRSKLWTIRQFAGFGSAAQTNARFKKLLDAGQPGLSTAFDLPTLMGYNADHSLARGKVGRWNFISVSGYHIREAGSTAVQELAFALADGLHYVRKALGHGLDIDDFAPRSSFFSTFTTTLKKLPSSGRRGEFGPNRCAAFTARKIPNRGRSGPTRRLPGSP